MSTKSSKSFNSNTYRSSELFSKMKTKINIWGATAKAMSEYFTNSTYIKSVNRELNYVRSTTWIQMEYKDVYNHLRKDLNMIYKRVSCRPIFKDKKRLEILKIIYTIEILNAIENNTVFVKIDEVLASNHSKINYLGEV